MNPDEMISIWEENKGLLEGRIRRLIGSNAPVEDLLQDVFVRTYAKANKLQPSYAAKYLMRTATNTSIGYLKGKRPAGDLPYGLACAETPATLHDQKELHDFYRNKVLPALETLSDRKKEAVRCYLNDANRREAAQRMGIPTSTLRFRQYSALEELRKQLDYGKFESLWNAHVRR
jgi:RNA polymerase sigma factor (sigma-70 family)